MIYFLKVKIYKFFIFPLLTKITFRLFTLGILLGLSLSIYIRVTFIKMRVKTTVSLTEWYFWKYLSITFVTLKDLDNLQIPFFPLEDVEAASSFSPSSSSSSWLSSTVASSSTSSFAFPAAAEQFPVSYKIGTH